jgi:hypothetical protein
MAYGIPLSPSFSFTLSFRVDLLVAIGWKGPKAAIQTTALPERLDWQGARDALKQKFV